MYPQDNLKEHTKKGHKPWNKGLKGFMAGKKHWTFGKKRLPETCKKISEHHKKNPINYWLGKKRSQETKDKISKSKRGKNMGSLSPNWKGGINKIDYSIRVMPEYKQWRSDIFQRDNWTCQTCGECGGKYKTVHHIKSMTLIIKEYNIININQARQCKELWDMNNGITLCEYCHSLTDNYKGRANKKG